MTFQDFLSTVAENQGSKDRHQRREEWVAAVRRLVERLRDWLAESDPRKLLDVVPLSLERAEPSLGVYEVPGLKISAGDASVQIVPVGRNAVGIVGLPGDGGLPAEGRVDVTDGARRYILYRTLKDGQESWYVVDERFRATPLDRGRLEEVLQDLLS
jgi:hypothetical protein